jgi:hypothetical protein
MTVADLKDLSPFMAIIVSMLALALGPHIAGQVARNQAVAAMREKWVYALRDCLVELTTEFDVLHETTDDEGLHAGDEYEVYLRRLSVLANRVRLMIDPSERTHGELIATIDEVVALLAHGIGNDYEHFHELNAKVKSLGQAAIRESGGELRPNKLVNNTDGQGRPAAARRPRLGRGLHALQGLPHLSSKRIP